MIGPYRFVFGLLLCLLINPNLIYSQDVVSIEKYMEDIVINPHVYILKDKSVDIQQIEKVVAAPDSAFRKNSYFQEVHYGFSQPSAWCKFTIKNTTDRTDWMIKVHHSRVDTVQLYVLRKDGKLEEYPMSGHYQPIRARAFHSLNFGYPISLGKDETVVCYLFTHRKFARHAAVISLQTEDYYKNYETRFIILISCLIGICVLASLIGIILFAVLYEQVYISYSIYCVCFLLLIIVDTGFFYAFFSFPAEQKLINNLSIILYYWLIGWHIVFTIELLKIDKRRRWLYWIGTGSGILFCVTALVLLLPIPDDVRRHLSQWSYYILFFLDTYILYAMIVQLIRKEVVVFFYMAGFLFTVFAGSLAMLADLQLVEGVNHRTDILFIAPVVEIVCMVIGLGINSSRYVKDRIKAQRQIITVQEDERKRIAQDIHDDVGNSLAAVKIMASHRSDHHLIEKELDDIIQRIRDISHDLMPVDFKKYKLADIVCQTVNKFKGHSSIRFEYGQSGNEVRLHPVVELVVYRMINELITNTIKHSQGTSVMVQLIFQEKSLVVMVEDDGKGMADNLAGDGKGIGLKNIRHRVAYINAKLTIESDHKGTLFIIETPYAKQN